MKSFFHKDIFYRKLIKRLNIAKDLFSPFSASYIIGHTHDIWNVGSFYFISKPFPGVLLPDLTHPDVLRGSSRVPAPFNTQHCRDDLIMIFYISFRA